MIVVDIARSSVFYMHLTSSCPRRDYSKGGNQRANRAREIVADARRRICRTPLRIHCMCKNENGNSRLVKQEHNGRKGARGDISLLHRYSESVFKGNSDRACDDAVDISSKVLKGAIDGDSADLYMIGFFICFTQLVNTLACATSEGVGFCRTSEIYAAMLCRCFHCSLVCVLTCLHSRPIFFV